MTGKHRAAILPQKGDPFSVQERSTPEPGPNEILIQVKSVAVNPVDWAQRDLGMPPVPVYPAVVGSDVAGIVAKVGSGVSNAPQIGARVIALATSYYHGGSPDHGAFQEYVVTDSEGIAALPDTLTFEQGAIFPLAVLTALSGWTTIGIPLSTKFKPEDKEAVLIWGGASSVGTFVIQSAKLLGFRVYVTASPKNHEYLKTLGADVAFDYRASTVISDIVDRVQKDEVVLKTAYSVVPDSLQSILDVLKETKGDSVAKVTHAPPLLPGAPTLEGVEVKFVHPPADPDERSKHIRYCFQVWLQNGLDSGEVVPSPEIQTVEGGLEGLNEAIDKWKAGVSGTKIVVSL